jgi:hypothetical protein
MTHPHQEHAPCKRCLDTGKIIYGSDTLSGRHEKKCACQKHTPITPHPPGVAKSYSPPQTLLHKRLLSLVYVFLIGFIVTLKSGDIFFFPDAEAVIVHQEKSDVEPYVWLSKIIDGKLTGIVAFPQSKVKEARLYFDTKL